MMVVSMLSSSPKNGVELMDEVERMTQGWWRPSPGSVYPLLDQLAKDGMIKKRDDGRYELTENAHDEVEWSLGPGFRRPRTTEDMMAEIDGFVSYLEDLSRADPKKAVPYVKKVQELSARLSRIAERTDQE